MDRSKFWSVWSYTVWGVLFGKKQYETEDTNQGPETSTNERALGA